MKLAIALIIGLASTFPVQADEFQRGYASTRTCIRSEYREEYVPGTQSNPGHVTSRTETIEVPCDSKGATSIRKAIPQKADTNDCSEGSLIGGLLGAGLATTGSRGRDRWWAIPAGGAAGAMLGCQIDGG